ncbi:MAG TPA: sigma-70 family RNA polymerase sigma factor [Balneolales bacterium]|jgi:RNA polymerase sigma-70 factor (ECF subfamily)|nr:sigma-70 family RNA polymerase sigma factor [Balneolales bacterium]
MNEHSSVSHESHASQSSIEDAQLVQHAVEGDENAYRKLEQKYHNALYYHLLKLVKDREILEDLIQEVFAKAFSNISSYNSDYAFSTWLYRIATNHAIDHLRKKKLKTLSLDEPIQTNEGEMAIDVPDSTYEADKVVIQRQRKNIIQEAIRNLPEKYRAVIEMRHIEEKSYQEISELLDLPLGTVKAHIFRARELLYKFLKEKRGTF